MATLHTVTEVTKKMLVGIAIGITSIIFLFLLARLIFSLKEYFFPTPEAAPTMSYGKLPQVPFPKIPNPKNYTYTLNTITGTLPTLPDRATVYKLDQPQPSLLGFDNVEKIVSTPNNGFTGSPTQLSDTQYAWQKTDGLGEKLVFDIVSLNFSLTSVNNYLKDQNVLAADHLLGQDDAISFASTFFQNYSSFPTDIDSSKTKATYYSIQNGTLIPAESFSSAQVVTVDFYQKDINNLPILYSQFPTSLMHVVIASGQDNAQVVEATFAHKNVLTDTSATYPIKTAEQAFEQLKQQKGFVANYDSSNNSVTIRNVFLAYYIGENPQQYLYPIIVFQGDNNFYGFVPAITDGWTEN